MQYWIQKKRNFVNGLLKNWYLYILFIDAKWMDIDNDLNVSLLPESFFVRFMRDYITYVYVAWMAHVVRDWHAYAWTDLTRVSLSVIKLLSTDDKKFKYFLSNRRYRIPYRIYIYRFVKSSWCFITESIIREIWITLFFYRATIFYANTIFYYPQYFVYTRYT